VAVGDRHQMPFGRWLAVGRRIGSNQHLSTPRRQSSMSDAGLNWFGRTGSGLAVWEHLGLRNRGFPKL
jgi:hypothetical protein